jgi:hypothetical protein
MFKGSLLAWLLGRGKKKKPTPDQKETALKSKPVQAPMVRTEETDDGLRLTTALERPFWQQLMGGGGYVERTYELDAVGKEVYELCDGKRNVKSIIRAFASAHKLSVAEAELSITSYLETLHERGLIAMKRPAG